MQISGLFTALSLALSFTFAKECTLFEHLVETLNNTLSCHQCTLKCKPGFGLTYACGNTDPIPFNATIKCEPCKRQHFSNNTSFEKCLSCRPNCGYNEVEKYKCLPNQNRFCSCKPGFYRHPGTGNCTEECCFCITNHAVKMDDCKDLIDGRNCDSQFTNGTCKNDILNDEDNWWAWWKILSYIVFAIICIVLVVFWCYQKKTLERNHVVSEPSIIYTKLQDFPKKSTTVNQEDLSADSRGSRRRNRLTSDSSNSSDMTSRSLST